MHVKCQHGNSAFSDEVFRYTRDMHTVWRWLHRYRGECRCIAQSLLTRLCVSHADEYNHNVDSTTDSWQRCTRDSKTRDSYTRNNSRVCWQQCTVSTCNARLLTVYCTRIQWQYTISMQCVEKTWNFVVKTKFCHILDNLRHLSALDTIIHRHHYQNDVWNDLRHLTV